MKAFLFVALALFYFTLQTQARESIEIFDEDALFRYINQSQDLKPRTKRDGIKPIVSENDLELFDEDALKKFLIEKLEAEGHKTRDRRHKHGKDCGCKQCQKHRDHEHHAHPEGCECKRCQHHGHKHHEHKHHEHKHHDHEHKHHEHHGKDCGCKHKHHGHKHHKHGEKQEEDQFYIVGPSFDEDEFFTLGPNYDDEFFTLGPNDDDEFFTLGPNHDDDEFLFKKPTPYVHNLALPFDEDEKVLTHSLDEEEEDELVKILPHTTVFYDEEE